MKKKREREHTTTRITLILAQPTNLTQISLISSVLPHTLCFYKGFSNYPKNVHYCLKAVKPPQWYATSDSGLESQPTILIVKRRCYKNCPWYIILLEKAMAPHSSTLAWKIPWTEEPGRLQSVGLLRVGHNWATSLSLFTFIPWRRKWQTTPAFLPWESQGRGSLVGCRLWGRTESDTTEAT